MSVAVALKIPDSHYNPSSGRFLSPDPIGFSAGDTNLYRYTGNNPVRFTDPMGLDYTVCNRPLDFLGGEALMSKDPNVSHTYIKFDDGDTISYGPDGKIENEKVCSNPTKGKLNRSQEQKMRDWSNKNYKRKYNLFNYNCKDFTVDSLLNGF